MAHQNTISALLVGKNAKAALEPFLKTAKIAAITEISASAEASSKMDAFKRSLSQAGSGTYLVVAVRL